MPLISRWTEDKGKEGKEGKIKGEKTETYRENDRGTKQIFKNLNICQIAQGKSISQQNKTQDLYLKMLPEHRTNKSVQKNYFERYLAFSTLIK